MARQAAIHPQATGPAPPALAGATFGPSDATMSPEAARRTRRGSGYFSSRPDAAPARTVEWRGAGSTRIAVPSSANACRRSPDRRLQEATMNPERPLGDPCHEHEGDARHGRGHDHAGHAGHASHAGHDHTVGANAKSLRIAFGLTFAFLVVELVGGIVADSLALLSDAAHMFTDTAALAIALLAIHISRRPADRQRTFGYHRFEILAAAFNAILLLLVAIYILWEAYLRLRSPPQVQSGLMLAIAVVGLVVNLASMRVLRGGQEHSLNVKGAYLEVWADMIGSIGVIVGAALIRFTGWAWIDSAVAVLIGLWVLPRTMTLLKSSINILLDGVPEDIEIQKVEDTLRRLPGVRSFHDLHVWSVASGHATLTVHLVLEPAVDGEKDVMPALRQALDAEFGLRRLTVQCETVPCAVAGLPG
jgi:cobalt-zinc-cadmium efflux system protein